MATHIFIDTNIWLDFYRSKNEAGLSLLNRLKELSKFIIVTDQVEMEFLKNRQEEIVRSVRNLTPPPGLSIPAFLACEEAIRLEKRLEEAQRLVEELKSRLPKLLEDPDSNDPVFKICHQVFRKADDLYFGHKHQAWNDIKTSAENRFRSGHPPRKANDTSIGDAINWEWIIHCARTLKSNIAIVSRDGDYGCFSGESGYVNDFLKSEFAKRVGKERKISLYKTLTFALKQYRVTVTEKEQQEENRMIQSTEAAAINTGSRGLYWTLANSPVLIAAEAAAKAYEAQRTILEAAAMAATATFPALLLAEQAAKQLTPGTTTELNDKPKGEPS